MSKKFNNSIFVIGGFGHVGLPLAISFANKNLSVKIFDKDLSKSEKIKKGEMPFIEYGSEKLLKKVIKNKNLTIAENISSISNSKFIVITIGTPIDEYQNPKTKEFIELIYQIKKYIKNNQILIIRSSVFPGMCDKIHEILKSSNIVYCPERIVQGYAIKEVTKLPQIISGYSSKAVNETKILFKKLTKKIIVSSIKEAELGKLFNNSLRYIQFAIANQFYMICKDNEVDYDRVRKIISFGYERGKSLPSAGLTAGPCLLKDTIQLHSFNNNQFLLGQASMMVNEGMPNYLINKLKKKYNLEKKVVGILGMAFKANIDDKRDSLSYKLLNILKFNCKKVICSDEYIKDERFVSKNYLIKNSDIIIIGSPHSQYKNYKFPKSKIIVDIWGITKKIEI